MTIETKYNIDDVVYYLDGMDIKKSKVYEIKIEVDYTTTIKYHLECREGYIKEEYVFSSKEELISAIK